MPGDDDRLLLRYLLHRRTTRTAPATISRIEMDVRKWLAFLQARGTTLRTAALVDALDFVASWEQWGWSAATVRKAISTMRCFHEWLCNVEEDIPRNPWRVVKGPRQPKRIPRVLEAEEVYSLDLAVTRPSVRDIRDRAIIRFLATSGCRAGELIALNMADVNLTRREAIVWGKGSKERVVFYTAEAAASLHLWMTHGRPQWHPAPAGPVFVGRHGRRINATAVRDCLIRAEQRARLGRHVNPHLLRHTFATRMRDEGADLPVIQELLGHADISTTAIYVHVSTARLRAEYERVNGSEGQALGGRIPPPCATGSQS